MHAQTRRKNELTILVVCFGAARLLNVAFGNETPMPGENVKVWSYPYERMAWLSLCAPTALADIVLRVTPPEGDRKTESLKFLSNNNVNGGRATHRISTPLFKQRYTQEKVCSNIKISFCVLFSHESCLEKSKIIHAKVSLRTSTVSRASCNILRMFISVKHSMHYSVR